MEGTMPAVVVQVVQRAKRAAQRRVRLKAHMYGSEAAYNPGIMPEDLLIAARSMKAHIERLKPVSTDERTPIEKAAATLAGALQEQATADRELAQVGDRMLLGPRVAQRTNGAVREQRVAGKPGAEVE